MDSDSQWSEKTAPPYQPGDASEPSERADASLLPDLSRYDLTVGEALDVFLEERRKLPSTRTLQRYCQEGRFDCYKLKTTRNGNPVHEWIINSTSLRAFVQTRPEDDTPAAATATPGLHDDTIGGASQDATGEFSAPVIATREQTDDARERLVLPRSSEGEPDVATTPDAIGDATDGRMSRAELLIENAKLTAQLDAQSDLVGELREDKQFMRKEITQHRQNDRLLADMHRETLQTLKAVAVAGRHTKIELPGDQGVGQGGELFREVHGNEQGTPDFPTDDV